MGRVPVSSSQRVVVIGPQRPDEPARSRWARSEGLIGRPGTRDDGALPDRLLATRHHVRTSHAPQGRGGHQVANIKPLEDKIVVQASEAETTTASGIVIPDTAKEKPQEGKVL